MEATITSPTGATFHGSAAVALAPVEPASFGVLFQRMTELVAPARDRREVGHFTSCHALALTADAVRQFGPGEGGSLIERLYDDADAVSAEFGVAVDRVLALVTAWRNGEAR